MESQNTKITKQKPVLDLNNLHEGEVSTSSKVTWRHEQKFWISNYQYHRLRSAFRGILYIDKHCYEEGDYNIRSLYFDSHQGEAAFDKLSGLSVRRKFRMRIYNRSSDVITMEIKNRFQDRISKQTCALQLDQALELIEGELPRLQDQNPVLMQLYHEMNQKLIKPTVLVEYDREAYVHPMGNVRITFDKNLRSGGSRIDIFHPSPCSISVHSFEQMILEVKFDDFLPMTIRKILSQQLIGPQTISKYYLCRQHIHSWENGQ